MSAITADLTRIRCGEVKTVELPLFGTVEVRCWREAENTSDLCPRHAVERAVRRARERIETSGVPPINVTFKCPAPTSRWWRCGRTLPCTSHDVPDWQTGREKYGAIWPENRE
ncbi:MAG TPA: hypothetical protein VGE43_10945 [Acidimicrobiales bacterium]